MNNIFRVIIAIISGVIISLLCISLIESFAHYLLKVPEYSGKQTPEGLRDYISGMPVPGFVGTFIAYALGTFMGSYTAARITKIKKWECGLGIGFAMILLAIFFFIMIPHPVWFIIFTLPGFILFSFLGTRVAIP